MKMHPRRKKDNNFNFRIAKSKIEAIHRAAKEESHATGYRVTASNWVEHLIDQGLAVGTIRKQLAHLVLRDQAAPEEATAILGEIKQLIGMKEWELLMSVYRILGRLPYPSSVRAQFRPPLFADFSPERQWEIDKALGILDQGDGSEQHPEEK